MPTKPGYGRFLIRSQVGRPTSAFLSGARRKDFVWTYERRWIRFEGEPNWFAPNYKLEGFIP